jgi:thiamine biosynthesis lipoprotein
MAVESDNLRRARPLLGTFVEISLAGGTRTAMEVAVEAAFGAIARVHRLMSFHEPASDVSRLNREAGTRAIPVDDWTYQVLAAAGDLCLRSNGMFDVSVGSALQRLGRPPGEAEDRHPRTPAETPAANGVELLANHRVSFRRPGMKIDLGGIAKGFAVDRAIDVLRRRGMSGGIVNAGGDLSAFGAAPAAVHLRDPRDPGRIMCHVQIQNEAFASTGGSFDPVRSAQAADCAVIDPRSQQPVRRLAGASVRAPTCIIADALTKLVMIDPSSAAPVLAQEKAGALIVLADGEISVSHAWERACAA